jgi:hypothetical protein
MLIVYSLDKAIQGKQPMILIFLLVFLHTNPNFMVNKVHFQTIIFFSQKEELLGSS